jgi:FSR family fosmidomycin resistance protein-like MFS transporter
MGGRFTGGVEKSLPCGGYPMTTTTQPAVAAATTVFPVLFAASFCHLLNDQMQALLPALYPQIKAEFHISYSQVGFVTLAYQIVASLCQPLMGAVGDRWPVPRLLPFAMIFTGLGLIAVAYAPTYPLLLAGAAFLGLGSAIFHPESSRVVRLASGGRHGLAQSMFQVGGNVGSSLGPLMAAFVVLAFGRTSLAWFSAAALIGFSVLWRVSSWHASHRAQAKLSAPAKAVTHGLSKLQVARSMGVLLVLIFSKYVYLVSISSFFTFYLIEKFNVSVRSAQLHVFAFLAAVAVGTFVGGPIGDRIGRKRVIWVSIVGMLPFTLLMPHASLAWTGVLSVLVGLIMASAFPAIVVFAQELMPKNVGMVAGMMFGFSFGISGISAAALGKLADIAGIETVYQVCAFLPLLGLAAILLPDLRRPPPAVEPR